MIAYEGGSFVGTILLLPFDKIGGVVGGVEICWVLDEIVVVPVINGEACCCCI